MASSDSISKGMFALAAVAGIAVSAVVGYFLAGGIQQPKQTDPTQSVQTPQPPAPVAGNSDTAAPPTAQQSPDFTKQGAPPITIREERAPTAPAKTDPTDQTSQAANNSATTPDSEASQEASSPSPPTDLTDSANTVGAAPASASAATPTAKPNSDQDYEQTDNGAAPVSTPNTTPSTVASGVARYRVQVGSFAQAISARSLADALRTRGYSTDTVTERDGGRTVYHVQAGAFRTRSDADTATVDLQRQGFPAFVSTISQ